MAEAEAVGGGVGVGVVAGIAEAAEEDLRVGFEFRIEVRWGLDEGLRLFRLCRALRMWE